MKLIFNNPNVVKWFLNHRHPKFLFKIYQRLQLKELIKVNNVVLKQIENRIEEINTLMIGQDYYRYRFPRFLESWQHLLISYKDIFVAQNIHLLTKDENAKNLTARTIAQLLYEYLEDFQKLNSKKLRLELTTIPKPEPILKNFDELKNWYKMMNQQFCDKLANIRHQTIAHKSKEDVKALLTSIKDIDSDDIKLASTFIFVLHGLDQEFRINVLRHCNFYKNEIANIPYPINKG